MAITLRRIELPAEEARNTSVIASFQLVLKSIIEAQEKTTDLGWVAYNASTHIDYFLLFGDFEEAVMKVTNLMAYNESQLFGDDEVDERNAYVILLHIWRGISGITVEVSN